MELNLVGYLLNSLDEDERRALETRLENDEHSRRHLALLRQALEPLDADRDGLSPPRDLVMKTIARVAEYTCSALPHAPRPVTLPLGPEPSWWRRPDFLVAACLLITALGIAIPAIFRSTHVQAGVLECKENLRNFGNSLGAYHDQHRTYPNVAGEAPHNVAGMMLPMLLQAGVITKSNRMRCPSQTNPAGTPALEDLRGMNAEQFAQHAPHLNPSYGYNLGHYQNGVYIPPHQPEPKLLSILPLMADTPPGEKDSGNSPNHGGSGQNVLYHDGSVKFVKSRNVGFQGDDIYLNKAMKTAAGLDPMDTVLGASGTKP